MTSPHAVNVATVVGEIDANLPITELALANGQVVRIDTFLLLGTPAADLSFSAEGTTQPDGTQVIPIIEERLLVGKKVVDTAKVRLTKTVTEYDEQLNEPLALRTFDIERILLNKPVDEVPEVRHEGLVTIYPVVEEQLVLTKQLILKEEVRITQRDDERIDTQVVTLRREHLTVEREELVKKTDN